MRLKSLVYLATIYSKPYSHPGRENRIRRINARLSKVVRKLNISTEVESARERKGVDKESKSESGIEISRFQGGVSISAALVIHGVSAYYTHFQRFVL